MLAYFMYVALGAVKNGGGDECFGRRIDILAKNSAFANHRTPPRVIQMPIHAGKSVSVPIQKNFAAVPRSRTRCRITLISTVKTEIPFSVPLRPFT